MKHRVSVPVMGSIPDTLLSINLPLVVENTVT